MRWIPVFVLVGLDHTQISGIIKDLPNYIRINHDGVQLSIVFLSLHGAMDEGNSRDVINRLDREASERNLTLEPA